MKKKLIIFLLFGLLSFLLPLPLYAADLQLEAIGNYEVETPIPNKITYTSNNITFLGTSSEDASVTISIDYES